MRSKLKVPLVISFALFIINYFVRHSKTTIGNYQGPEKEINESMRGSGGRET
jgi:hypothetical protein